MLKGFLPPLGRPTAAVSFVASCEVLPGVVTTFEYLKLGSQSFSCCVILGLSLWFIFSGSSCLITWLLYFGLSRSCRFGLSLVCFWHFVIRFCPLWDIRLYSQIFVRVLESMEPQYNKLLFLLARGLLVLIRVFKVFYVKLFGSALILQSPSVCLVVSNRVAQGLEMDSNLMRAACLREASDY